MYMVGRKSDCLVCKTMRPLGLGFWLRDIMTESMERSLFVRLEARPREARFGSLAAFLVTRGMGGNDLTEELLDVRRLLGRCGVYVFFGNATAPFGISVDARDRLGRAVAGAEAGAAVDSLAVVSFGASVSFCCGSAAFLDFLTLVKMDMLTTGRCRRARAGCGLQFRTVEMEDGYISTMMCVEPAATAVGATVGRACGRAGRSLGCQMRPYQRWGNPRMAPGLDVKGHSSHWADG